MNAAAPGQGDGEGATPPAAAQRPANGQRPAGMRRPGGNAATNGEVPARRPATVRIVQADGSEEERRVVVGITSRVSAEIINGLQEGDQVIAGIVQAAASAASARNQQATFGPPGGFGGFR